MGGSGGIIVEGLGYLALASGLSGLAMGGLDYLSFWRASKNTGPAHLAISVGAFIAFLCAGLYLACLFFVLWTSFVWHQSFPALAEVLYFALVLAPFSLIPYFPVGPIAHFWARFGLIWLIDKTPSEDVT